MAPDWATSFSPSEQPLHLAGNQRAGRNTTPKNDISIFWFGAPVSCFRLTGYRCVLGEEGIEMKKMQWVCFSIYTDLVQSAHGCRISRELI